jgi:hypothetical protein
VTPDSASVSGAKPANEVTPDLDADSIPDSGASAPKQTTAASASEPYRELIEQALNRGRNAKAIWQDLVDDHGFTGSPANRAIFMTQ